MVIRTILHFYCISTLWYVHCIALCTGTEFSSPYCRILLTPDLSKALSVPPNQDPFAPRTSAPSAVHPPSLGLLIQHLRECAEAYSSVFESYQHHSKKMEGTNPLSSEDIRQVWKI